MEYKLKNIELHTELGKTNIHHLWKAMKSCHRKLLKFRNKHFLYLLYSFFSENPTKSKNNILKQSHSHEIE